MSTENINIRYLGDEPHPKRNFNCSRSFTCVTNFILVVLTTLAGLFSLINGSGLKGMVFIFMILAPYQLLSAFIGGLFGDKRKLIYFAGAITYLSLLLFVNFIFLKVGYTFPYSLDDLLFHIFIVIIPYCGAVYYTLLCSQQKSNKL